MSSITINGLPVCIEWQQQLKTFLGDRLPGEDVLFARWQRPMNINPLSCGNAPIWLDPGYPKMPTLKIGELQWPTGASRYARALYAVDWTTLRAIMESAWGYTLAMSEDIPPVEVIPTDVPDFWEGVGTPAITVTLEISGGYDGFFRTSMSPLSPYRVPGAGIDLWLLPMVDSRYFWQTYNGELTDPTWPEFFGAIAVANDSADPSDALPLSVSNAFDLEFKVYGDPDPRLNKSDQPQPACSLLDVGAMSTGLRIVCNPATNRIAAMDSYDSRLRRNVTQTVQPFGITEETSTFWTSDGTYIYRYFPDLNRLNDVGDFMESGLPTGIDIDEVTGEISGSTAAPGVYPVTISRGDASYDFTLVIETPGATSGKMIAGGYCGRAGTAAGFRVYCQRDGEATEHTESGDGVGSWYLPIWTTWEDRPNGADPSAPDGRQGVAYSYMAVVGTTGSYSAVGLPSGLSIHGTTGEISGTPGESGTFEVEITRGVTVATLTIVISQDHEELTENFVLAVAADAVNWQDAGGQYCFAGPIAYQPNGYDDFFSIEIYEKPEGDYVFRSRIYELPPYFMPPVILAGGEEPECAREGEMYRFEIFEDIENGDGGETPETTTITNFRKTTTVTEEGILVNVDGMIDYARAGFFGECKYEGGKYWFVQARCGQICESTTSIAVQTPPNARIGRNDYSWTPTTSGTVNPGSWLATGLPVDWDIDLDTGEITGPYSGVLGPEQYLDIRIQCTGPKTDDEENDCIATRKIRIRIVGA